MSKANSQAHLVYWIVTGLILSFCFSALGSFFPFESLTQTLLFKLDTVFALTAFAALSVKMGREQYDIPAAGYIILTISQGLFLSQIDEPDHWKYQSALTAVLFLIPSLVMISYYPGFPKWLRIAGLLCALPFLILAVLFTAGRYGSYQLIEHITYIAYQLVTLCWAWYVWKDEMRIKS